MDSSIINRLSGYFHDGYLIDIKQSNDKIEISMESSQMFPDEILEVASQIQLSDKHSIRGILHLEGVKSIRANHIPLEKLKMKSDVGEILDFDFEGNKIILGITWVHDLFKLGMDDYVLYEIEAEIIYWENIPDLYDPTCDEE